MYLRDGNILRALGQGHATLRSYLLRVPWSDIALPSVVVAEVLRGRCDFSDVLPQGQLTNWIDDPPEQSLP